MVAQPAKQPLPTDSPAEERIVRVLRDRLQDLSMSQAALAKIMADALPDRVWDQSRVNKFLWRQIPIDVAMLDVAARGVGLSLLELIELSSVGTITRRNVSETETELLELIRRLNPTTAECVRGLLKDLVAGASRRSKRAKR
jgi:hypothetical protein